MVAAIVMMLALGLAFGVGLGTWVRPEPPAPVATAPAIVVPDEPPPAEEPPPAVEPSAPATTAETEPPPAPPPAQVAVLPPPKPPQPPATAMEAALWLRHAVPSPRVAGRPMIVVIIDDLGLDRRRAEQVVKLPGPLTLSFMSYASDLSRMTAEAHQRGHELMVHVPMQPMSTTIDAGPQALMVGLSQDEIRRRLDWALSRFDGYIGINNHMGSRFTADPAAMAVVMAELRRRGLAFVDSVTSAQSVGVQVAHQYGVPVVARDVFLDNDQSVALVQAQLAKLEARARRTGFAIAIGHPHDATITALAGWLPSLQSKGFVLVPVSTLIRNPHPN